ncbi:2Fe-2S ferredoxin-type domain-containing protein [Lactarius deliciosus]|nr:2Fe-2S ferredoxin-type domain-containing protein [Lactarius deliciosus]
MSLAWQRLSARSRRLFINAHSYASFVPIRTFHPSSLLHGNITRPKPGTGVKLHFRDSKGQLIKTVEANEGDDILSIAHEHDIDLEGACEGSVACSTCHVVLSPEHYDLLPEPEDDENDMLDMAFGLSDTSRLGCQVRLTRELDGMTATLPAATRNMFVDGGRSPPAIDGMVFQRNPAACPVLRRHRRVHTTLWSKIHLQTFSFCCYLSGTSSPKRLKIAISLS